MQDGAPILNHNIITLDQNKTLGTILKESITNKDCPKRLAFSAIGLATLITGLTLTFGGFTSLEIAVPISLVGSIVSVIGLASLMRTTHIQYFHEGTLMKRKIEDQPQKAETRKSFALSLFFIMTCSLFAGYYGFYKGVICTNSLANTLGVVPFDSITSSAISAAFSVIAPLLVCAFTVYSDNKNLHQAQSSSLFNFGIPLVIGTFAGVFTSTALAETLKSALMDEALSIFTEEMVHITCVTVTIATTLIFSFLIGNLSDYIKAQSHYKSHQPQIA